MKNQPLEAYSQYTELRLLRGNQEIQNKQCIFCGHHFPYFQGKLHLPYFSSTFYFRKYPKSQSQSFIKNEPMLLKVIWKKKIYKYNMNEQLSWIFWICKRTLMLCYGSPSYINLKTQRISKWDAWLMLEIKNQSILQYSNGHFNISHLFLIWDRHNLF